MTYPSYGLYGMNPNYTLAQTPYSRATGQYTTVDPRAVPNAYSYAQPMFIDTNAFFGNTGIPTYPSLISSFAMNNPQYPLAPHAYNQYNYNPYCGQAPQQGYNPYNQYQCNYNYSNNFYQEPVQYYQYNIYNNFYQRPQVNNQFSQLQGFNQWIGGVCNNFINSFF